MSDIDAQPEVSLVTLITFSYGDSFGTKTRYTSCTNPVVAGDGTFQPEPSMEVTMNAQTGSAQDVPVQVRMVMRAPLDTLTSQRCHSPVRVVLEETDPGDLTTRRKLFAGVIKTSDLNPDGKSGIVQFEIAGWRFALQMSGNTWLADTTCNNTLGDGVCRFDLTTVQETGTVSAINGTLVTLTGLTTTAVDGYWRWGYLAYDGLQILVRDYSTGSQLTLMKPPPASWIGQVVKATPGCDKRLATCRAKFNNEARFTGFGLVIPAYNPLLEST